MKKRDFFHSAGTTVAIMIAATLLSKVLGLVRQMMTAGIFAASTEGVAFSVASRIPLAIFDMLFSTAIVGAFLPIYKSHLSADGKRASAFSSAFLTAVLLVTSAAAALGVIAAPAVISLTAPDLDTETALLAAKLLRIMFPSMVFAGMAYILIGILQSHEKFLLPAFVSALSNLVMILYLALCEKPADRSTAIGMAVAYLISWGIQFFTLAIPLLAKKSFPWPTRRLRNPDTALSLRRSLPVMFGSWLIPMITLITGAFSSFIDSETVEVGTASGAAIVVYENAFSVFTIAAGLLTYGVCNYIFPKLSETFAKKEETAFEALIAKGLFASLTLMLPIAVLLFLLSRETVSLLYLRGHFTEGLAAAASASLRILSLAIPAYGLTELFSRVCYACGKVRYPMAASLGGIACTLIFDSVCLLTSHLSVRTAAFGNALGMIASALILGVMTFSRFPGILRGIPPKKMFALIAATVTSGGCMALTLLFLHRFSYFSQTFQNFITIAIVFAVGFVVYLIWLIMTKIISSDLFR